MRPPVVVGSLGCFGMRIHSTSMGAPMSCTTRPAAARTAECRPSAPITRSARTCNSPCGVRTCKPVMRPSQDTTPVASACISSRMPGYFAASSRRKSRNSHCGIIAMNLHCVRSRAKSARTSGVSPITAPSSRTSSCGRARNSRSRPSSCRSSKVDGCTVSPRKSRRKSACFSSTTTDTPARARRSASMRPAGPPPAMQQRVSRCGATGVVLCGCQGLGRGGAAAVAARARASPCR